MGMSCQPVVAEDNTVLLQHFMYGHTNYTMNFTHYTDQDPYQLEISLPPNVAIIEANVSVRGIPGDGMAYTPMDFDTEPVGDRIWALHKEATGIIPLTVDPGNNDWNAIPSDQVNNIKSLDGKYWYTKTPSDPSVTPWEYPVQLFHFQVDVDDAVSFEVKWKGRAQSLGNNTVFNTVANSYFYNYELDEWEGMGAAGSYEGVDYWMNKTAWASWGHVSSNGSVDFAIVGPPGEVNNTAVPPRSDHGHIWTDYINITAHHKNGTLEYPEDVKVRVNWPDDILVKDGPLDGTVVLGADDDRFKDALQTFIDGHSNPPFNVTIEIEVRVSERTFARVEVLDLNILYDSTGVIPNDPPKWVGPSSVDVKEDGPWKPVVDMDLAFTDDHDEGDLGFAIIDVSHDGALDTRLRDGLMGHTFLEVRPLDHYYGDVEVVVGAWDTFMAATEAPPITVHIEPVPDAPWLLEYPVISVNESEPLELPMTVLDPDMPDDSFTFSDTSDLFDIDPASGVINWTPTAADLGRHTCTVTVEDSYGLTDSIVLIIDVLDVNHRPVITSVGTLEAQEGQTVTYWITAEDEDIPQGDTLTFSAWSMDVDLTVDALTGKVSFTTDKGWVGQVMFFIRAEDSLGEGATASVTVDVVNVNDPPTLTQMASQTHLEGATVSVRLAFDDPDLAMALEEPELLTITTDGPSFLHADADGFVNLTVDQSMVGEHVVTYTVTDREGLSASIEVLWTLLNVNEAPSIITNVPSSLEATEDEVFTYTVAAIDSDGDDLTWSDDSPLFQIDPATGVISFIPTQAQVGSYVVTLTVSDGNGGSASVSFDLEVVNVNDAPVIVTVLPQDGSEFKEGDRVQFSVEATDEDGDALTFVWREGSVELGAGSPLTLRDMAPGAHTITLVVSDGHLEATRTLDIYVEPSEVDGTDEGMPIDVLLGVIVGIITAVLFVVMLYQRSREEEPPEGS